MFYLSSNQSFCSAPPSEGFLTTILAWRHAADDYAASADYETDEEQPSWAFDIAALTCGGYALHAGGQPGCGTHTTHNGIRFTVTEARPAGRLDR
jgi:hypothetical protein